MKDRVYFLMLSLMSLLVVIAPNAAGQQESQCLYNFENSRQGWVVESHRAVRGEVSSILEPSKLTAYRGTWSLKLNLDLDKGGKKPSQVEIRVDLRTHAPGDQFGPLNLENKVVRVFVYFPYEFEGESNSPNGIQLFAKSVHKDANGKEHWRSLYGLWYNASGWGKQWLEVRLRISAEGGEGVYIEKGFDPKKVCYIGVKFGLGTNASPNSKFAGDVFLDCIYWKK